MMYNHIFALIDAENKIYRPFGTSYKILVPLKILSFRILLKIKLTVLSL